MFGDVRNANADCPSDMDSRVWGFGFRSKVQSCGVGVAG